VVTVSSKTGDETANGINVETKLKQDPEEDVATLGKKQILRRKIDPQPNGGNEERCPNMEVKGWRGGGKVI